MGCPGKCVEDGAVRRRVCDDPSNGIRRARSMTWSKTVEISRFSGSAVGWSRRLGVFHETPMKRFSADFETPSIGHSRPLGHRGLFGPPVNPRGERDFDKRSISCRMRVVNETVGLGGPRRVETM